MTLNDRWGRVAALAAMWAVIAFAAVQAAQLVGLTALPWDAAAIYLASLCIAPPFLVAMQALHRTLPLERQLMSATAASFATAYLVFAMLVYGVQLGSYLPYLAGRPGAGLLDMRPHSAFWTVDALAYIAMGAAALFAALALPRLPEERSLRGWLLAHAAMTPVIGAIYFAPRFSVALLMLGVPWLATAVASLWLLARRFGRATAT